MGSDLNYEAAAVRMNDLGWTCTAHEPLEYGECDDCADGQMNAVIRILDAALLDGLVNDDD